METAQLGVTSRLGHGGALDLANALNSLSGVIHVDVNAATHVVTVQYDGAHASPDLLAGCIKGAGYAPDGA
jgi:copper chaperone CopZ